MGGVESEFSDCFGYSLALAKLNNIYQICVRAKLHLIWKDKPSAHDSLAACFVKIQFALDDLLYLSNGHVRFTFQRTPSNLIFKVNFISIIY